MGAPGRSATETREGKETGKVEGGREKVRKKDGRGGE